MEERCNLLTDTDLEEDVEDIILESIIPLSFSDIKSRNPSMSDRRIYHQLDKALSRGFVEYTEVEVDKRKIKYYKEKKG